MLARRRPIVGLLAMVCWLSLARGAPLSAEESSPPANDSDQFKHGKWPFFPAVRPAVPEVQDKAWVKNPLDAFILHALEQRDLKPNQPAEKRVLLRRVTFDLIGLPPTADEQARFWPTNRRKLIERVVDRLLASPRYGERWAQHWLDLVRYAETDGFKEDAHRPDAHKYRDYVIRALNDDLPYDRFIRQQLAGDELEPDNPEALVATGLYRLYPDEYNATTSAAASGNLGRRHRHDGLGVPRPDDGLRAVPRP